MPAVASIQDHKGNDAIVSTIATGTATTAARDPMTRVCAILLTGTGTRSVGSRPAREPPRYSATLMPDPPISFGTSFIFGSPS